MPIDLDAERTARREQYDGRRCDECGGAWFDAVVVLGPNGHINGHDVESMKCHDCGRPAYANGVV